jgi:hypothetical protein
MGMCDSCRGLLRTGYTNPSTPGGDQCRDTQQGKRVGIEGVVLRSSSSSSAEDCCDQNSLLQGKGWTFVGHLFQPLKDSCTIYSSVQKKTIARRGTVSGTTEGSPTGPVLWPSWPASSPYVCVNHAYIHTSVIYHAL